MRRRTAIVLGVVLVAGLGWAGYTAYVFHADEFGSHQQTVLMADQQAAPNGTVSAHVSVRDRATEASLDNASVSVFLVRNGSKRRVATGTTGSGGGYTARFHAPASAGEYEIAVRAESAIGTDTVSSSLRVDENESRYSLLVDTDKPVYQPGGTVHIRGLVRGPDGDPVQGTARAVVTGPDGTRLFSRNVTLGEYGMGSLSFPLASVAPAGRYRVSLEFGGETQTTTVQVKEYVTPRFDVRVRQDQDYYKPGETVQATVRSEYFFGKPVANATVRVTGAGYVGDMKQFGTASATTDEDGVATVSLRLPSYFVGTEKEGGRGFAVLNVSVTDAAGHTETVRRKVVVAERDLLLGAIPAGGALVPGTENTVYLTAHYPDGEPAEATIRVNGERVRTNEFGVAAYEFTPTRKDRRLELRARAGDASARTTAYLESPKGTQLALLTDRAGYRVGDTLSGRVLVGKGSGAVYLDVTKSGRTLRTETLQVTNGTANFSVDLPPGSQGELKVRAWAVFPNGKIGAVTRPVMVRRAADVSVNVSTNRSVYRPGERATLTVRTREDGRPVPAAVGLDIVDEAVFSVEERRPGLSGTSAELQRALTDPTLEVHNYSVNDTNATGADLARQATAARHAEFGASGVVNSYRQKQQRFERMESSHRKLNGALAAWLLVLLPLGSVGVVVGRRGTEGAVDLAASFGLLALGVVAGTLTLGLLFAVLVSTGPTGVLVGMVLLAFLGLYLLAEGDWSGDSAGQGRAIPALGAGFVLALLLVALLGSYVSHDVVLDHAPFVVVAGLLLPAAWVSAGNARLSGAHVGKALAVGLALSVVLAPVAMGTLMMGMGGMAGGGAQLAATGGADAGAGGAGGGGAGGDATAKESEASGGDGSLRIRDEFPETLATKTVVTGADGTARTRVELADSITTWRVSALASTRSGALGSARGSIRVFQPFFVKPDVPVALTGNDSVTIPVSVFNYGDESREVTVTLRNASWFSVANRTASVEVPPESVRRVAFRLRAVKHGERALTFVAAARGPNGTTRDAVRKSVTVDPRGKRLETTRSGTISGTVRTSVRVPQGAVPNSSKTVLRVYPGAFGQVVGGMGALLSMPTGCFEQTSSSLYPNVLALRYMERTGQTNPELRMTADRFITQGYQRILTFETSTPGGYSLFGNDPPNLLLTAYGLMELSDMRAVHDVDPQTIGEMRTYLRDQQRADGSWPTDGRLEYPLGVSGTKVSTTAYVTWSLAHSGADGRAVERGTRYLRQNLAVEDASTMTLAIALNALVDAGKAESFQRELAAELKRRATVTDDAAYWNRSASAGKSDRGDYRYGGKRVLTTATAANALVKGGYHPGVTERSLRWLAGQKSGDGGWGSTQNTVMALKALVNAQQGTGATADGTLTVVHDGSVVERVDMSGERGDEAQTFVLPAGAGPNEYEIRAPESEGLYYELSTSYHAPWSRIEESDEGIGLNVSYDRTNLTVDDTMRADVTLRSGPGTIGMAIVDLGVPPGFTVEQSSLQRLEDRGVVSKYELAGQQVVLYLENVEETRTFSVAFRATQPVEASTGSAKAYDYYNPDSEDGDAPTTVRVTGNATVTRGR